MYESRWSQRGFTMVELIVVIVIVGILATVAVVSLSSLNGFDEAAYRDELKSELGYARKVAVARRRAVCVELTSTTVTLQSALKTPENGGVCTESTLKTSAGKAQLKAPGDVTSTATTVRFNHEGLITAGAGLITFTNASTGGSAKLTVETSGYAH